MKTTDTRERTRNGALGAYDDPRPLPDEAPLEPGPIAREEIAGASGLVWMSIGAFIMKKMISFEI